MQYNEDIKTLFKSVNQCKNNIRNNIFGHKIIFIDNGFKIEYCTLSIILQNNTIIINDDNFIFTYFSPLSKNPICTLSYNGLQRDTLKNFTTSRIRFINEETMIMLFYNDVKVIHIVNNVINVMNNINVNINNTHNIIIYNNIKFFNNISYQKNNIISIKWCNHLYNYYELLYDLNNNSILQEQFTHTFNKNNKKIIMLTIQEKDKIILQYEIRNTYDTYILRSEEEISQAIILLNKMYDYYIKKLGNSKINEIKKWYVLQSKNINMMLESPCKKEKVFIFQNTNEFVYKEYKVKNLEELLTLYTQPSFFNN